MLTDTSASPYALATSVAPGAVTLADGPWLRLHERTADVTVRAIGAQLHDPSVGHAYENFRIAAGDTAGEHAGPPFMDGDLYKWLEAAAALQAGHHDDDRAAWIAEAVDVIGRAQRADGYVHTQTLIANRSRRLARAGTGAEPEEPLEDRLNFETYNLGHLMTAGVVLHRATGDDSLLALGRKAADYIHHLWRDRTDLLARSAICPSHYMGVVELYRATRDERYLALAEALLDIRDRVEGGGDDNQDRVPLREQRVIAGHAVRANYLYAGAADVVAETGDAELLAVLEGLWRDLVATKLSITGGCGALYDGASPDGFPDQPQITRVHQAYGRPYQLPSTTAHNESCASIGLVLWGWRMLTLTGDAQYADTIEQVLLNALPATIGVDGRSYFYANPLRQVAGLPYDLRRPGDTAIHPVPAPPPSDERLRQEWLSCFCCPPNIARILAELPYLLCSATPDGLAVHQYVAGDVTVDVAGAPFGVAVRSDLHTATAAGRVTVTVTYPAAATLRVRVPGWAPETVVSLNGTPLPALDPGHPAPVPGTRWRGYHEITRDWSAGDQVVLEVPLRVRTLVGHPFAEEIANHAAIVRGGVVYCLESHELPPGVTVAQVLVPRDATWEPYPLSVAGEEITALRGTCLVVPPADRGSLYSEVTAAEPRPLTVTLVPYAVWANRGPSEMSVWLPLSW